MKTSSKVTSLLLATIIFSAMVLSAPAEATAQTVSSPLRASEYINYTGNYYDVLGGLDSLLDRTDSASVLVDLRALIGYSSTSMKISTGETIKGTDSKHPSYSGTGSNSLAAWYEKSDRMENDPNDGIKMFYTNDYITTSAWNREHLWPQSKSGGLYGKTGGGSDLHHIRPTYSKDNSKHGSYPFGEVYNGEKYYCNNDENSYVIAEIGTHNQFEPLNSYKGDIARIYAYMVTHYPSLGKLIGDVLIGGFDTIVDWNAIDPVDAVEINRNNVAFECQGNRNPFIDAPELIDIIWGDGTGSSYGNYVAPDYSEIPEDTEDEVDSDNEDSDVFDSDLYEDNTDKIKYEDGALSLKKANLQRVDSRVTLRGQVAYVYGNNTVILEEINGEEIISFQIYDKNGVSAGKYALNSIVTVTGKITRYNGILQIKDPTSVTTYSENNEPIPAIEATISDLGTKLNKYVVLRNMTLGKYNSTSITLKDEKGDTIECYKPAKYPNGIYKGDVVDVYCVAYQYKDTIQLRITNSSDYVPYRPDSTTSIMEYIKGDVDGDEQVTLFDVIALQRCLANLPDSEIYRTAADVNEDGRLNMRDVVIISQYIAEIIDDFSVFSN